VQAFISSPLPGGMSVVLALRILWTIGNSGL
jgi:hypothetical protein